MNNNTNFVIKSLSVMINKSLTMQSYLNQMQRVKWSTDKGLVEQNKRNIHF